jgi:galactokinase
LITHSAGIESIEDKVLSQFMEKWGAGALIFRAPGRVNLIGEHTDYNEGFVMPAAINFYTWIAAAPRKDHVLEVYSDRFHESVALQLDALDGPPRRHWSDFIRGVAATLQAAGYALPGANLLIHGDVPLGAGLSSSASLETAAAMALTSIAGIAVPRLELAKLCQSAEHNYVGTRCGIMDQFIASFGVAGHALMLDCRSLEYQLLRIPENLSLVICNSMVRHELATGEYNHRRADCETGVRILQDHLPQIKALRDVTIEELERYQKSLPERVYRRCRHVITENDRVLAAAVALRAEQIERFGELMYGSHASMRDDYEISCKELDTLVDLASSFPGVYGARMTGGGFGGCTINLVRTESALEFKEHIAQAYSEATGIVPEVYICKPSQGAEVWKGKSTNS